MFIPANIAIGLLIFMLMLLACVVLTIRQVRILDRELKEAQIEIARQKREGEIQTENRPEA